MKEIWGRYASYCSMLEPRPVGAAEKLIVKNIIRREAALDGEISLPLNNHFCKMITLTTPSLTFDFLSSY